MTIDGPGEIAGRARGRLRRRATAVVAVAGPVAVGKSRFAADVATALLDAGVAAVAVSTDGFLLPNAELRSRGILMRKGFPDSYDVGALRAVLATVRTSADPRPPVTVPVYSHDVYDIVADARRTVESADVWVLEGVNALSATSGLVDLGVYVDAPLDVVESWFVQRFLHLCAEAGPRSFYAQFAGMGQDALEAAARDVYRSVNLPNLVDHIAPSRRLADVVVEKRLDHTVGEIVDRATP